MISCRAAVRGHAAPRVDEQAISLLLHPAVIFKTLACDFDGTLASEDRIGVAARAALGKARAAGLQLILVTGRTFFELTRVCDCLDLFDAVVAENGAVLYFPRDAMIRDQGPPPPGRLLAELDRRGIAYQAGRVIVGTGRADESPVRAALESAAVSCDLVYNRAALMLVPTGISKGKGLEHVLRSLGLSFHDVLAVGDAENDLALFEACGWAACPANGVPAVQARADWVFPGEDGEGVAAAITGPILKGELSRRASPRHRIALGWAVETSTPLSIPARDVNVLIHGDPLSGKSWLAGALIERLAAARYAVCVIDPEGDYRVLASLPGMTWAEIESPASLEDALAKFERDPAACVILDLSALPHESKLELIETALEWIGDSRRRRGFPHWVILDEAHYSLHREGVAEEVADLAGKGFCLATYRPSWLRDATATQLDVFVLARTTAPEELGFLGSRLGDGPGAAAALATLPDLPEGEFIMIEPGAPPLTFVAAPRATAHVRHRRKYADSLVPFPERFIFRSVGGGVVAEAQSIHDFRRAVATVDAHVLGHHAGRGDFSRWVLDVFSDRQLAGHLRKTELRWRQGEIRDLRRAIDRLIASRYGTDG
jgi:hydroxymethylpyrimidine pyrophosphatase-like HAD family hydrolase